MRAVTDTELVDRLDRYLDAVPRSAAGVESMGALTLFTKRGAGFPYYARPTRGWAGPVTGSDIEAVRRRQRELAVPEAFEWLADVAPSMRAAGEEAGLRVEALPLMVLTRPLSAAAPAGVRVRMLDPDDQALHTATAVADVAFSEPALSAGGAADRDAVAAAMSAERVAAARARMRAGLMFSAVAEEPGAGPLCVGSHQPVGPVTEIVGVGTLPSARRRGLAAAVTALLVADAVERGVTTVFLSAGSDDVARMYGRVGFVQVGTSCIAEPR